ncbi:toll/interleukin-1 receptor domain-containing protein [Amycolatopsis sp. NPDC001319]|uniref:toll/interleukin-1 receptor domain-containing protein n=1 Tax=unclassified Amycolatopsis TaxID=2618356 RepID=UPI00368EEF2D
MNQIFLSYRTADERFGVALLDQELSQAFGSKAVFFASKSIAPGSDWEKDMFKAVGASSAVLVVMGRNWLDAKNAAGERFVDDPRDFVRREITTAFDLGKRVIPVRMDAPRVSAEQLPEPLRMLPALQDISIHFRNAKPDIDRLAARLRELIPDLPAPTAPPSRGQFTAHASKGGVVNQYGHIDVRGDFHAGPRFG